MKKGVFKKNKLSSVTSILGACLFTFAAGAAALYGMKQAERGSAEEGRRILEDGLRRAVVSCYANEGRYPESLSYIEENYGVRVDGTKYAVFYEIEASNVFPTISVFESEEGL